MSRQRRAIDLDADQVQRLQRLYDRGFVVQTFEKGNATELRISYPPDYPQQIKAPSNVKQRQGRDR